MLKVICISGKAQHGKDTASAIIRERLEHNGERVLITHYADLVKYICKAFFNWNGEKDEHGRSILQHVGTDVVRQKEPDYWVNFIAELLEIFENEWDWVLIPDTRFPNEVDLMKEKFGAIHIRVVRTNFESTLTDEQKNHPSETSLDNVTPDFYLMNNGNLDDMRGFVNKWIKEIIYAE